MLPLYTYLCPEHGEFSVRQRMLDAREVHACPTCGVEAKRFWRKDLHIVDQLWNCQGAHRTDYDEHGDKLERLNRNWSKKTGMAPPPADRSVPRNSSDIT